MYDSKLGHLFICGIRFYIRLYIIFVNSFLWLFVCLFSVYETGSNCVSQTGIEYVLYARVELNQ